MDKGESIQLLNAAEDNIREALKTLQILYDRNSKLQGVMDAHTFDLRDFVDSKKPGSFNDLRKRVNNG